VNQSLMKLRKQRAIRREVSLDGDVQADVDMLPMEIIDWAPNPEQLYLASESRNLLHKALGDLRPFLRTVFVLRDIEGLSIDQAAEVLSLTQTAVKARLSRARLQLRERLNRYFRKQGASGHNKLVSSEKDAGILGLSADYQDPPVVRYSE
jgi:RNA polymerase sigma-70 factor (ECF subfamily)